MNREDSQSISVRCGGVVLKKRLKKQALLSAAVFNVATSRYT